MEMPIDMQHQAMGYDRTATMFSPEGHLLQVEYAEKTVRLGSSSIGMVCEDGVFILADKRMDDPLVRRESSTKIHEVDNHVIASVAGIVADARVLVEKVQLLAQQHRVTYDSPIEPELIIKEIANTKQMFTQYGGARPFGVAFMAAGVREGQPELYSSDITGNYFSYYAHAIGENDTKYRDLLKKKYDKKLTIKQGVKLALDIFSEVQEKNFAIDRFEMAFIENKTGTLQRVVGDELKVYHK